MKDAAWNIISVVTIKIVSPDNRLENIIITYNKSCGKVILKGFSCGGRLKKKKKALWFPDVSRPQLSEEPIDFLLFALFQMFCEIWNNTINGTYSKEGHSILGLVFCYRYSLTLKIPFYVKGNWQF